jgi:hypothetical protein
MNKMIVAATAALIATTAFVGATAPANAGNLNFSIGIGGWGPGYAYAPGYYGGGGVYVAPPPVYVQPQPVGNWQMHVNWCASHYNSYNPNTNMYVKKIVNGQPVFKNCNSPYA